MALTQDDKVELARLIVVREALRDKALARRFKVPLSTIRNIIYVVKNQPQRCEEIA